MLALLGICLYHECYHVYLGIENHTPEIGQTLSHAVVIHVTPTIVWHPTSMWHIACASAEQSVQYTESQHALDEHDHGLLAGLSGVRQVVFKQ